MNKEYNDYDEYTIYLLKNRIKKRLNILSKEKLTKKEMDEVML